MVFDTSDRVADALGDDGDDGIAVHCNAVASHPGGYPMSHSEVASWASVPSSPKRTNCSFKGRELRSKVASLAFPDRQSRFVGVASRKPQLPGHFSIEGHVRFCDSVGVRIVRKYAFNDGPPCRPPRRFRGRDPT